MRGGRFQQKTTEDANLRNAEALFESRTVVDIREVEANTRKEIEEKKEDLRQLVGASYRDLIESADSIVYMKNSCENVARNISEMEDGFKFLKNSMAVPVAASEVDKEKKKREKLYGIGSRVKYIVDTPEKIWGCLDEHMYLEGAQRYFRAREVQTLLTATEARGENKELLSHFPLLRHQWSLVETFRGQISQRSRDRLLEPGLDVRQYAVALAAVAVIDELSPSQIFSLFFETRRAWLRAHLRTAMASRDRARRNNSVTKSRGLEGEKTIAASTDDRQQASMTKVGKLEVSNDNRIAGENFKKSSAVSVPDIHASATVLCKAANIIQSSLCHAGQLFLEVEGDLPLFFSTVLNSPPGSQLFGGIPNPEDEAQLWKLHWEKLETRMSSLSGQFISETCKSWIHICREDVMAEGKTLLDLVERAKDLVTIEQLITEEANSQNALEGSMEWLESAFGQSIDSPWDYVVALLLKEPLNLWNTLFESMFVERAKEIIEFGLARINIAKTVDDSLASITSSWSSYSHDRFSPFQILGLGSTDSRWFAGSQRDSGVNELSEAVVGVPGRMQEEDWFGISSSNLGSEVAQLKEQLHTKLRSLFEDCLSFIQGQHNTPRSQDLTTYLQKHCFIWMSNILNGLQMKLFNLSDGVLQQVGKIGKSEMFVRNTSENLDKIGNNRKVMQLTEADALDISSVVEKALFLGRIFVTLSQDSWALPAILYPSQSWNLEDTNLTVLARLPSLRQRNFWLDGNAMSTKGRPSAKAGMVKGPWKGDDDNHKFTNLQLALRYSSLMAHGIWVSWSAEVLTTLFAKDLLNDEDLASLVPLKGWEETVLRQRNEGGDEIEVRLPLPAMPSLYVISFLFKSCQEIYRIGGHALDKAILQMFAWRLLEKVLIVYEDFLSKSEGAKTRVSEKGSLQILFDLRFLGDMLSGGQRLSPDSMDFLEDEQILSSVFSTSNLGRIRHIMFQSDTNTQGHKNWLASLQGKLSSCLDPIDWATYEPHIWENEQQSYQRCAVLFGFLVQLNRLYRDTAQKPFANTQSNALKVSARVPRFTYLPISTPSLIKKSSNDESGALLQRMASRKHASGLLFEDDSSFSSVVGAKPLLRSLMNQVGSKFGEGTLRLGSMLADGQVSRLKDRSAAAISTFGEILPAQAAGLFSSFTAGTTKSEMSYY